MISLRGELRRDRNSWKWAGVWAFGSLPEGASLASHSKKAKNPSMRPFIYAWHRPRNASNVLVPSAHLLTETQVIKPEASETEQQAKIAQEEKRVSHDPTQNDKKTPDKAENTVEGDAVSSGNTKEKADLPIYKDAKETDIPAARSENEEKVELQSSSIAVEETNKAKSLDTDVATTTNRDDDEGKKDAMDATPEETVDSPPRSENKKEGGNEKIDASMATKKDGSTESIKAHDSEASKEEPEPTDLESSATISEAKVVSRVTYASTLPGEPEYTEAGTLYEDKCPTDGTWTGYFENVSQRKDRNCSRVQENFCLFFNATPSPDARALFLDSPQESEETTDQGKDADGNPIVATLPPGHIHVRGKGTNQFGTFELLGSYNLETKVLECQRMYVTTVDEGGTPSRRRQSATRATRTRATGEAGESGTSSGTPRAYNTRKRQLSWKRANVSDDEDYSDTMSSGRRSGGGKKRARTLSEGRKSPVTVDVLLGTTPKPGVIPTINVPAGIGAKRSSPSPRSSATPRKRSPPTSKGGASATASAHLMKLPVTADPRQARWRAAHFMYYQRSDPAAEEVGGSTAPSFVVYEGELLNGDSLREGRGICLYSNGTVYEGSWKRNKEHGVGTLMTSDRKRIIYKGEWERGKMHGRGVYNYAYENPLYTRRNESRDGTESLSRYEGEFKENTRHGMGKYVLPNGSFYEGEWRDNVMSGRGTFHWVDGSTYVGQWKDGQRNGQGVLVASDGFKYDGTWVQNAMEGRGIATYPSGQQYEGLWVGGRREGRGTIRFTNGAVYEGRFRDDCIEGQGTMKMQKSVAVPRPKTSEEEKEEVKIENEKDDWMIPIHFQSDMGHIHQKAGFTLGGN